MDAAPVRAAQPTPASAAPAPPATPEAPAPAAPAPPQPGAKPADGKQPEPAEIVGALVKGASMIPQAVSSTGAIMAQLVTLIDEKGDVPPEVGESLKRLSIIATLTDSPIGDPAKAGPLPEELTADPVRGVKVLEQSLMETIGKLTTAFDGAGQALSGAKLSEQDGEQLSQAAAVVEQARTAVWAAVKLVPPAATEPAPTDGAPAQPAPAPAPQSAAPTPAAPEPTPAQPTPATPAPAAPQPPATPPAAAA